MSLVVEDVPVGWLRPNEANPNTMNEREFNGLVASLEEEGWVQPCASVVEIGEEDGHPIYEIVGGHHRWDAAKVLGHEQVPCVLLDPEKFDEDRRNWNLVKQNILHGSLNPEKFTKLYDSLTQAYDREVMQTLMGFTSEDAFRKVYKEVKAALPKALQDALEGVKDEIKTIDDLSLVLNRLFRDHGETLPSNMMVFSWGGKEVLWVRASDGLWAEVSGLAKQVAEEGTDMSAVLLARLTDPNEKLLEIKREHEVV